MQKSIKKFHKLYYPDEDYNKLHRAIMSYFNMVAYYVSNELEEVKMKYFGTLKPSKKKVFKEYNQLKYKLCPQKRRRPEFCEKMLKLYEKFLYER